MAIQTFTNMAVAYNNFVSPSAVSSVVTTGISGFLGGFEASNLEFADPWIAMKTASISGQPIIEFQFSSAINVDVLGILNHNIGTAGYGTVAVERWNGSGWDAMGTMSIAVTQPTSDMDVWVAWTSVSDSTRWRFKLGSGAAGNFYIGSVFWGVTHICATNPIVMNQSRRTPITFEVASGGAKYAALGADVRPAVSEITFVRTTIAEVEFWRRRLPGIIGILTPEHGDAPSLIEGQDVFWGYITNRTVNPRGPGGSQTTQQARYDMTIELEGAV